MRVDIKGTIVLDDVKEIYDWFGITATSPADVRRAIHQAEAENHTELTVVINSGGGSVWAGSEMFYDLKNFKGTVKVEIPSVAASAASFLAMAADHVAISILGQMMVHNASTSARGNYMDMNATSEFLQSTDKAIINAYMLKTKKSEQELQALMDKTTWMNAQEAKAMGFVDEILFEDHQGATNTDANNDAFSVLLPPETIAKAREILATNKVVPELLNHSNTLSEPIQEKGNDDMDLRTLENKHPALFKQVKHMGYTEGVKAENARIQAIEEMAIPGNETLVHDAKFTNPIPAAQFAISALKAQREVAQNRLMNRQKDAAQLNEVPGTNVSVLSDPKDEIEKEAEALAAIFKKGEGN